MKQYEQYLFDESEKLTEELKKELATEVEAGLFLLPNDLTIEEQFENRGMCDVVDGIFQTICKLFDLHNIELCTGSNHFSFDTVIETIGTQQKVTVSPKLSRDKLKGLSPYQLSGIIIELFLDRENWSKEILYSTVLSDGEGNWLI